MNIEWAGTDSIFPYPGNPRVNDAAVDKAAASISEFKWRQPIVVDSDRVIIAGHTRLKAALKLGLATVPVHVADGLSPAQVKAYRIADNKTGELAEWDDELLSVEMGDLQAFDFDLELTGFSMEEIEELLCVEEGIVGGAGETGVAETNQLEEFEYQIVIACDGEAHQGELLEELDERGLKCRPLIL